MSAPDARILFLLLGDRRKASARVRGWWIGEELERRGHQVEYSCGQSRRLYPGLAWKVWRADIVVFQKRYSRYDLLLAQLAKLLGRRCYFDIDDAADRAEKPVSIRNSQRMMALSDAVLAGNRSLAELALRENDKVELIPSSVPLANYTPRSGEGGGGPPCLGWIGNGAEYAEDLIALLAPPLAALARSRPLRLRIVGGCGERRLHDAFGAIEGLECEIIDQLDWGSAEAVAEAVAPFEIGLYPLIGGPYNDYKCGFKAIEYMALGLPVIASDVANNAEIVLDGETGFIARDAQAWETTIAALLDDPAQAAAMGRAGRARVEREYSIARACDRLEAVFAGKAGDNQAGTWNSGTC